MADQKPKHPFVMKTCEVCQREHRAFPRVDKGGRIYYTGVCPYCREPRNRFGQQRRDWGEK